MYSLPYTHYIKVEMKEEERLAAVVARIDEEVAIVPRGAYMRTPHNEVVTNKSFPGTYLLPICITTSCTCTLLQ